MDFDKIKPAVESIQLSETQKEDILNTCQGKKRKFNYKPLATVAAVIVITLVCYGLNGTLFGAKMADEAENAAPMEGSYVYTADEDADFFSSALGDADIYVNDNKVINQSSSITASPRPIYKIIPSVFSGLVDKAEFEEWYSSATTDEGMLMMQFVIHFGIEKADFEKANADYALELEKIYGEPATVSPEEGREHLEIFNSDIIYSFDRNVVDGYYCTK